MAASDFPQTPLKIEQGQTWGLALRWPDRSAYSYKTITAIAKTAPVRITCPSHGLVDGWPVAVVGVKGMVEINAGHTPPRSNEFYPVTYIDANTVDINAINAAAVDENGTDLYTAYTSGGSLQFYPPVDLTNYSVSMRVLTGTGGTLLLSSDVADDPLDLITVAVNNTTKTISLTIAASDVDALTWTRGVYDIVATHSVSGAVTKLMEGTITVSKD